MNDGGLQVEHDSRRGVATLTLARPERHNAFDDALVAALDAALERLAADDGLRVLVLAARGRNFSAGADLGWMRRMAQYPPERNRADAAAMARMFARLEGFPAPTVAIVQGAAYGGGVGLVAACDIALASHDARFALSEVRLGLVPAVISHYLVAAVGQRACRRLFLTAEVFDAARALQLGLVHEVTTPETLGTARDRVIADLLAGGPRATREAKALLRRLAGGEVGRGADSSHESSQGERLQAHTAALIAELRASAEGREGLAAFLEKRRPAWHPEATVARDGA